MAEHVWHIITGHSNLVYAHCLEPDCEKELNRKEIECRVNTSERLIAAMKEPAIRGAKTTLQMCAFLDGWIDILEGK